jgi:xanthine dehydrogenase accessory factor
MASMDIPAVDLADPLTAATAWMHGQHRVALATVTRTWGSAPRPGGSQMAVREDGAFTGSVSGGCVEGAVIGEAQNAIRDGKIRNLKFGVSDADAWAVGLACGGTIEVHVAPVIAASQQAVIAELKHARDAQRAAVLAIDLSGGESRVLFPGGDAHDPLTAAARLQARRDQSAAVEIEGRSWFLTVFNTPLDLAIVGAVHIAQPLSRMATLADYAVRVIDPRTAFANAERFPGLTLVHEWPDEALTAQPLTARSAIVALTHDPKFDDPALAAALKSPAFYIGALGSRTTHARRLDRLRALGFADSDLARIHGPIGLDLGARSPAEIAVAILGQMTAILRKG